MATKSNGSILILAFSVLALLFGTITALFGGALAVITFLPIFLAIFIVTDYRIGVVILVVILPFQHTPFLPSFTGFNIVNYLTAATLFSLLLRHYFSHKPVSQFPKIFWWAYLLPILFASLHGLTSLNLVPQARLELIGVAYDSPKNYLAGLTIRPLLIVLVAWMLATAVIDSKQPKKLVVPIVLAGLLPAFAILVFVANSGFDLTMMALMATSNSSTCGQSNSSRQDGQIINLFV